MARRTRPLPPEVEPGQVWRDPDDQHFYVLDVEQGVATVQRCTADGKVLNPRYRASVPVYRMRATFVLVK